jgi:hypothetical protein
LEGIYWKGIYKSFHQFDNILLQPFVEFKHTKNLSEESAIFFVKTLVDFYIYKLELDPQIEHNLFDINSETDLDIRDFWKFFENKLDKNFHNK